MNPPDEHCTPLGTHLIHIDGDTLVLKARGTMTAKDVRMLLDWFVQIKQEHGALFVVYDGRQCTGFDAGARKVGSAERTNAAYADLRVAFGLPFTIRVLLNMVLYAQKAMFNRDVPVPVFEKEADAWAFFEKERARIRQEKGLQKAP